MTKVMPIARKPSTPSCSKMFRTFLRSAKCGTVRLKMIADMMAMEAGNRTAWLSNHELQCQVLEGFKSDAPPDCTSLLHPSHPKPKRPRPDA